jgi:beta-carotene ketolase (CrtO type)
MYDVVIIGGGNNGLACAAYLARAGRSVAVLEARPLLGGYSTSEETVAEAPGFVMNGCALDLTLPQIPRSVIDELDLPRHGLRTISLDPYCTWIGPDGAALPLWCNVDRTVAEIARFSRQDAEQFRRFVRAVCDTWYTALPYLQGHPTRVSLRTVVETLCRAGRARRNLSAGLRIFTSSPAQFIEEWFESEQVRAAVGCWAATGMAPFSEPGNAGVLSFFVLPHRWGALRAVGGMGAFVGALAACARAHGAVIRPGARVREITVEGGHATGVVLDSGERIRASHTVAALDPTTLFTGLLDPVFVSGDVRRQLRAMDTVRYNITIFKGDAALTRRPRLPRHDRDELILAGGYTMLAPTLAYLDRTLNASTRGELSDELPFWFSLPSIRDRTLVPPGSQGETLYIYTTAAPYQLAGQRSWEDEKQRYLDRCLAILEEYSPGIGASVIGTYAKSPAELAQNAYRGNALHVDMTLAQMGPWRPIPALSGYRTPIQGLWHAGAGAHPVPGVGGWSGRTAARTVLRALRNTHSRDRVVSRINNHNQEAESVHRGEPQSVRAVV